MPTLGKDLKALRKEKELSINDVQKKTRIPLEILESIEDDSIFSHLGDSNTYTRSYVRSYAKALGITEPHIVYALNQVEKKAYNGSLTEAGFTVPNSLNPSEQDDAEADEPQKKQAKDTTKNKTKRTLNIPAPPSVDSQDWVNLGRPSPPDGLSTRTLAATAVGMLILIGAAIFLWFEFSGSETTPPATPQSELTPAAPSDSLRQALTEQDSASPAFNDTDPTPGRNLPDTLSLAIIAANGKLEPVRIYTDLNREETPYWVPQGDTLVVNFVNTATFRAVNQYDRLQLMIENQQITDFYDRFFIADSGHVQLSRSQFEENY